MNINLNVVSTTDLDTILDFDFLEIHEIINLRLQALKYFGKASYNNGASKHSLYLSSETLYIKFTQDGDNENK